MNYLGIILLWIFRRWEKIQVVERRKVNERRSRNHNIFTIPALLIEVIVFVLGAIVFQPIDHAEEACVHIVNWSNSYTPIMLMIFAAISVLISFIVKDNMADRIINIPAFFYRNLFGL